MTDCKVTAYVNTDGECFAGYKPGHPVAKVDEFAVAAASLYGAAHRIVDAIGRKIDADDNGKRWPDDVRSFTNGDVLCVQGDSMVMWFAVTGPALRDIQPPRNIVPIEGSYATTRKAGKP